MTNASQDPPHLILVINPDSEVANDPRYKGQIERDIQKYQDVVTAIGEAYGWGNNPRYDLVLDAGIKALIKEG